MAAFIKLSAQFTVTIQSACWLSPQPWGEGSDCPRTSSLDVHPTGWPGSRIKGV